MNKTFEFRFEDCYVYASSTKITIGNGFIEQSFDIRNGALYPFSILDKSRGVEWLSEQIRAPLYRLPGTLQQIGEQVVISASVDDDFGTAKRHVCVHADLIHPASRTLVRTTWNVYPGCGWIQLETAVKRISGDEPGNVSNGFAAELKIDGTEMDKPNKPALKDYIFYLPFRELHSRFEIVEFKDVTDHNNNLVQTYMGLLYPSSRETFDGNIAFIEQTLKPGGLMVLKEGPTKLGRIGTGAPDFVFQGRDLYVAGSGFSTEEEPDSDFLAAHGCTIGVYDGEESSRSALLEQYHRNIHAVKPERDFFIMSNTWGDRSKDGRVSESFILAELEKAAKLGITHVQIDDGWQTGTTVNSTNASQQGGGRWSGYHSSGIAFWEPNPARFPNGLEPCDARARELGIHLGLWFSPDSDDDFAHWKEDADILISFYRRYAISYFKLDGILLRSKKGERNLLRLMRKVVAETDANVYFNLDTTAQVRLGYFGRTQYGALFLENRYSDWKNYYPHWTLRNLWMLSQYVPARKLQIEFLNVRRNASLYGDDPLAPNACGMLYSFAAALFSNPLAWMELTGLADEDAEKLSRFIRLVSPHHESILSGQIVPIGNEPSGASWTGLQSIQDDQSGYILVFRELNKNAEHDFKLWGLDRETIKLERIAASAGDDVLLDEPEFVHAVPDGAGRYRFKLPAPLAFALYRYSVAQP